MTHIQEVRWYNKLLFFVITFYMAMVMVCVQYIISFVLCLVLFSRTFLYLWNFFLIENSGEENIFNYNSNSKYKKYTTL